MTKLNAICRCAYSDGIPKRALFAALLVGTVLNLINQGDALLGYEEFDPLKAVLTYLVPYAVGAYGAVSAKLSTRPAAAAAPR